MTTKGIMAGAGWLISTRPQLCLIEDEETETKMVYSPRLVERKMQDGDGVYGNTRTRQRSRERLCPRVIRDSIGQYHGRFVIPIDDGSPGIVPVVHLHMHPLNLDRLLQSGSLYHCLRREWWTSTRASPSFSLSRSSINFTSSAKPATNCARPVGIIRPAKPVASREPDHSTAQLSLPSLSIWTACGERISIDFGVTAGHRHIATVGRNLVMTR